MLPRQCPLLRVFFVSSRLRGCISASAFRGLTVATELRLGTRGSQLALWQANTVAARIAGAGGPPCRIVVIQTSGDRLQEAPLSDVGGKRLFVKEIEDALLRHEIDLAVHSSKDMPAILPTGLTIAAVLPREDPLDAIVLPRTAAVQPRTIDELVAHLGQSPSIGTGSVRRIAQLTRLFPGARFSPIRGNLDTRLRKLDEGAHDALVLAAAGLRRLGFASRISFPVPATACVPAPGQGIVAVEIRDGDARVQRALEPINDDGAGAALTAERALVEALGGGCQTPIGALATPLDADALELVAVVAAVDGSRVVRARASGSRLRAANIGAEAAGRLMQDGAGEILAEARRTQTAVDGLRP
ncbi:MAG: hydroxymethylbilane synthase [Acidobacteria bacterium]|nr:MAG: hydroxymethylbilane synthase [Acidobacteriota bacterium]